MLINIILVSTGLATENTPYQSLAGNLQLQ